MDVRFINPVIDAMLNVLSTMAQLEPRPGQPSLKQDNLALGPVSSVMDMTGDKANGSIAITFSKPVIQDIAKRMLGEDIEEINDTAENLTGEIANMVIGGAKNTLSQQGYDFDMSTPSIISGTGSVIDHKHGNQTILLPFVAESGNFYIELCFDS